MNLYSTEVKSFLGYTKNRSGNVEKFHKYYRRGWDCHEGNKRGKLHAHGTHPYFKIELKVLIQDIQYKD
jgi:hypothetical protein